MPSATVRISNSSHEALRELASRKHASMQAILDEAIESYRRQWLLEEANAAFAALRQDGAAWEEELRERQVWEATLPDGEGD